MPILIIPFVVFFACAVAQFWSYRRLRQALVQRHPDVFLAIAMKAWSMDGAVMGFAFNGKAKALGDPVLMTRVRHVQCLVWAALVAWLSMIGLMVTGVGLGLIAR